MQFPVSDISSTSGISQAYFKHIVIFINKCLFNTFVGRKDYFGICAIPALLEYYQNKHKMVGNDKVKRMGKDSNKSHTQNYVKQKILLPTLKERQRYLVYQALFKNDADNKLLTQEFKFINDDIIRQCSFLLGVFDGAAAGIMGVKFNNQKLRGIIRVDNKYVDKLKVCLGLIKTVKIHTNDQPIIIDTIFVSGILNKAEEKII